MLPTMLLLGLMFLTWCAAIWASYADDQSAMTDDRSRPSRHHLKAA